LALPRDLESFLLPEMPYSGSAPMPGTLPILDVHESGIVTAVSGAGLRHRAVFYHGRSEYLLALRDAVPAGRAAAGGVLVAGPGCRRLPRP
jgi:hypothetical protein